MYKAIESGYRQDVSVLTHCTVLMLSMEYFMRNIMRFGTFLLLGACCFSSQVLAADLPTRNLAPVAPAPIVVMPPAFTWTGFYAGINVGYSKLNSSLSGRYSDKLGKYRDEGARDAEKFGAAKTSANDWSFGGQVGYNYQFGSWVAGVEADFAKHTGKVGVAGMPRSWSVEDKFGSTVRARLGYAFDRLLVYGTGGLALSQMGVSYGNPNAAAQNANLQPNARGGAKNTITRTNWHAGYVVGAGVEYAVTDNVTVKAEYLYTKLNKKTYVLPENEKAKASLGGSEVRMGLNYKF